MTRPRASLFEEDTGGSGQALDLSRFGPRKAPPAEPAEQFDQLSEEAGFTTRHDPKGAPSPAKIDGRSLRATGRNAQFNINVTPEAKARFWQLASEAGVRAGGEFFEQLMDAWERRNIKDS